MCETGEKSDRVFACNHAFRTGIEQTRGVVASNHPTIRKPITEN
jgi:hypothetical protein